MAWLPCRNLDLWYKTTSKCLKYKGWTITLILAAAFAFVFVVIVLLGMRLVGQWYVGGPYGATGPTTVVASSGNVAAATATATLAAVAGKTQYLEGFDLTGSGPTTASAILLTITGLLGGTQTYTLTPLAGILLAAYPNGILSVRFPTPLPASAVNTAIAVVVPSLGSGSTNSCVVAYGFQV